MCDYDLEMTEKMPELFALFMMHEPLKNFTQIIMKATFLSLIPTQLSRNSFSVIQVTEIECQLDCL